MNKRDTSSNKDALQENKEARSVWESVSEGTEYIIGHCSQRDIQKAKSDKYSDFACMLLMAKSRGSLFTPLPESLSFTLSRFGSSWI